MKVTTNIKKMDLIRLNLSILPKLKSTYITILSIALLAFIFICWKDGFPQCQKRWIVVSISSLIGGICGMLFGAIISMVSILFMSSSKNGILGEHEYTISPEGLHEKTSANEGLSKWEGISDIKIVGSYLLFQISGYLFHVIPLRSFESKENFEEYHSVSVEYWKNFGN